MKGGIDFKMGDCSSDCFKVIRYFQCMNSQWVLFIQSSMYACVINVEMALCIMSPSLLSMHFLFRSEVQQRHLCQMPLLVDIVIRYLMTLYSCWCVLWLFCICAHTWISAVSLEAKIILRLMYVQFAMTLKYCDFF